MRRILVERWKSGNAKEAHLFRKKDQRGWAYILGWNPNLFSDKEISKFLKERGIIWRPRKKRTTKR